MKEIDAQGLHYRSLNKRLRGLIEEGEKRILLKNVCGQRYIGDGVGVEVEIIVEGVPGNDLASFMDGPRIIVRGNAQDGVGNTLNRGEVIIHGDAGDIVGYSMRGGRIFIQGNVGYRVGIHMKAYREFFPVVVVGGGNSAATSAAYLANIAANVKLVHRKGQLRAEEAYVETLQERNVGLLWNSEIGEIRGDGVVETVVIRNNKTGVIIGT